jgi:hypothetical protein
MTPDNPVLRADKVDENFYKCTHERNISCENLDTFEDCIDSASPYSISEAQQLNSSVDIDVSGYMNATLFSKISGTNQILEPSDDFFGFSKCQWAHYYMNNTVINEETGDSTTEYFSYPEFRCFKNSDDSPPVFINDSGYGYEITESFQRSDCGGFLERDSAPPSAEIIQNIMDCRKDFTPPITNIPHYEEAGNPMRISANFEFPAVVSDSSIDYSAKYPDTFACISDTEGGCYPRGKAGFTGTENIIKAENTNFDVGYNIDEGIRAGIYHFHYFSEDVSHNLEVVRSFPVYIDPDPPNVVLSFSNTSYELIEDLWRTDLTINMQIIPRYADDDEFAFCDAKMYLGNNSIYPLQDIISEFNNTWTREYTQMPDDIYRFWYRCVDDVGNVAEENITIMIDGDKSITNPMPRGTVNNGNVVISVETGTNAECRYTYSVEDLPAFWDNITFAPTVFDTMVLFDTTGSEAVPTTIHHSNVNLGHGYHRYYVKCRMFNDDKIRGNNADQIRFAVDTVPPVSSYSTSVSPYNSWFNQPVRVTLNCGDPPIFGKGLDWSFGCANIFYCVGMNCSNFAGAFREYVNPIQFANTDYISYYSVDMGGNQEETIEDILFQIDNTPPELNLEFFDGLVPASVIVMNRAYKVRVTSNEPLISPAVAQPYVVYTSDPTKFAGQFDLFPTENPSVWEGIFFLENINANKDFEGNGIFTAWAADNHNVTGYGSITVPIDTKPPTAPVVEPSLELPSPDASDYQAIGYPVHYYDGVYYTNSNSVFITGYTDEYLDMIAVTSSEGIDTEKTFTQTPAAVHYNDSVVSGFAGLHEIAILGDITRRVNSSLFMGLDEEKQTIGSRQVYGGYGTFYDVRDIEFHADDELYTSVLIYPVLEENLDLDRPVVFYDQEYPSFWFGIDVDLDPFKSTAFYLKSYDDSGNLVRYPSIAAEQTFLEMFSDPIAPLVISSYPRAGSTSKNTFDIEVKIKEGVQESGLYEEGLSFTLNGEPVTYFIEHDLEAEANDPVHHYFRIYAPVANLEDGIYHVAVDGSDLAKNWFDETNYPAHWAFDVDTSIPEDPEFRLVGGRKDPTGGDRWYVDHSPDFIIDFSLERDPVTVVDVFMESAPSQGNAAVCNETDDFNVFLCRFTTPKPGSSQVGPFWADYGVIVEAFQTLADGTDSDSGMYGPFPFTVDDEAPDFDVAMNTRFMGDVNLTVGVIVRNEHHPLEASMGILGGTYAPYYSSNNGSFYYFIWDVPDFDSADEGATDLTLTLSDFAGNSNSKTVPVYIDLTPPSIADVTIEVSDTVPIGTELFTAQPNVTVSGTFVDEDIFKVWIMPGDYDPITETYGEKKNADLIFDVNGIPESFIVSVNLMDPSAGIPVQEPEVYSYMLNYMLISQINNMTLFVMDTAGHLSHKPLRVISDIAPPLPPTFCVGEEGLLCMPVPPI